MPVDICPLFPHFMAKDQGATVEVEAKEKNPAASVKNP